MPDHKIAVIVPYFNYSQYDSRRWNYTGFITELKKFPVRVITVECVFGKTSFDVTTSLNHNHIQVRARHPLWVKEALINIGCQYASQTSVQYYGWIDADLEFTNLNWVEDTIHALETYPILQPFESIVFLGSRGWQETSDRHTTTISYGARLAHFATHTDGTVCDLCDRYAVPGGAWMIRRDVYEQLGGLIEYNIVGGGDDGMAFALTTGSESTFIRGMAEQDHDYFRKWVANATAVIQGRIGFVPGVIKHHWHGRKTDRHYGIDRESILTKFNFSPSTDLRKNADGVPQLVNKRQMKAEIARYFDSRKEDA